MKKGFLVLVFLLLVSCGPEVHYSTCKQDYDCGKCVNNILFGMSCLSSGCDPSTQYTQFNCEQEIKREFGESYHGACVDDGDGAHCAVAAVAGGRACTIDADCNRCDGAIQYSATCNSQSHQCDTPEDRADCDAIIGAQFGKPGTCKQGLCQVVE